jgi:hypothetical protein
VLAFTGTTFASEGVSTGRLTIVPEVSFLHGSTDYEIDANAFDPSAPDSTTRIRSLLKFPLDMTLVGATAAYSFGSTGRAWSVRVAFKTSLSDPSELMTDEDWFDEFPVSYTESSAKASMLILSGHVSRQIMTRDKLAIALFGGIDFRRTQQDIIGYDGWQDLDRNGVRSPVRGSDSAIIYEVTYFTPEIGVRVDKEFSQATGASIELSSGLLFASDTDDHLLRGIKSEGDGIGVALGATGEFRISPVVSASRNFWIGLLGGVRYHYAEGNVTKTWYRDEGTIPAGTVDADIPYSYESLQTWFGARLGFSF